MKKTFILLSIVFMIVMALASLSFANKTSRNFNEMISDPIITVGPPTPSVYGQSYTVKWNVPRCRSNQSRCVEGYEVMIDYNANVVFSDNTNPLSNTFLLKIDSSTVKGSPCANIKHQVRVRAYKGKHSRWSKNHIFSIKPPTTFPNPFTAVVDNSSCVPRIRVFGFFKPEIGGDIKAARVRVVPKEKTMRSVVFQVPQSDIQYKSIDTTIQAIGNFAQQNSIYLDVKVSDVCVFVFYLGNFSIQSTVLLTCDYENSGNLISAYPQECGGIRIDLFGKIIDPNQCLDEVKLQIKDGNNNFLTDPNGNVSDDMYPMHKFDRWYTTFLTSNLNVGDFVTAEVTYSDKSGYTQTLFCSGRVERDVTNYSFAGHGFEVNFSGSAAICDGNLWTWGSNVNGKLGINTPASSLASSNIPQQVTQPAGVTWQSVSTWRDSTLALDCQGNVWSWGSNANGQLGIGINDGLDYPTPQPVAFPPGTTIRYISNGTLCSYAIDQIGQLWGWGYGPYLGFDPPVNGFVFSPRPIPLPGICRSVVAGDSASLAIVYNPYNESIDGVYGWGLGYLDGEGLNMVSTPSLQISGNFNKVSVEDDFYAALSNYGDIFLWGTSEYGQRGNGISIIDAKTTQTPERLEYMDKDGVLLGDDDENRVYWTDVSVGVDIVLSIDNYHQLWGWGYSGDPRVLGCDSDLNELLPKQILIHDEDFTQHYVSWGKLEENVAWRWILAEDLEGRLWGWGGMNLNGELGPNVPVGGQSCGTHIIVGACSGW